MIPWCKALAHLQGRSIVRGDKGRNAIFVALPYNEEDR